MAVLYFIGLIMFFLLCYGIGTWLEHILHTSLNSDEKNRTFFNSDEDE